MKPEDVAIAYKNTLAQGNHSASIAISVEGVVKTVKTSC